MKLPIDQNSFVPLPAHRSEESLGMSPLPSSLLSLSLMVQKQRETFGIFLQLYHRVGKRCAFSHTFLNRMHVIYAA